MRLVLFFLMVAIVISNGEEVSEDGHHTLRLDVRIKRVHPYTGIGYELGYVVDGVEGEEVILKRGDVYTFHSITQTAREHPLYISSDPFGNGSGSFERNVEHPDDETLIFAPDDETPDLLYYQCVFHSAMGWKIRITPEKGIPTPDPYGYDGEASEEPQCNFWMNPEIFPSFPEDIPGFNDATDQKVIGPGLNTLGFSTDDDNVKEFHLFAQPVNITLFNTNDYDRYSAIIPKKNQSPRVRLYAQPNVVIKMWGYNGNSPGPVLEVTQGDEVRIILHNELTEATTLHWHGMEVPWEMDGAGGVSENPVLPGDTREYRFKIKNCGTYMYHAGTQPWKQVPYGLYGMLVSHCKYKDPSISVDKDYAIVVSDLFVDKGCIKMGVPNHYRFNQNAAPTFPVLKAKQGDNVRLRFAGIGSMTHPIHIHGHQWTVIAQDGPLLPTVARYNGSTIALAPGQTYDAVLYDVQPGIWRLHCHLAIHQVNTFAFYAARPFTVGDFGAMHTLLCVRGMTPGGTFITCEENQP
eukprot:TRINITY_DN618_c0_g1_i1.p1 TRINITY_DN618_c0_g1~~TRINITY_DN618_c0_g1_i1.p1  ORF type:complete len:521 (+),score=54.28 TRINITY_DN618_c0_g1_i1:43-1605(+)